MSYDATCTVNRHGTCDRIHFILIWPLESQQRQNEDMILFVCVRHQFGKWDCVRVMTRWIEECPYFFSFGSWISMASCGQAIIWLHKESMLNPRHFSGGKNLVRRNVNNFSCVKFQVRKTERLYEIKKKKTGAVAVAKKELKQNRIIFLSISLHSVGEIVGKMYLNVDETCSATKRKNAI